MKGFIFQPLVRFQIVQPEVTKSTLLVPPANQTNIIPLYRKHKMFDPGSHLTISLQNPQIHLRTDMLRRQLNLQLVHIIQILHFLAIRIGSTEHEQLPILDADGGTYSKLERMLIITLAFMPVL